MPARDIMPFKSPLAGTYEIRYGSMNASETFEIGELVFVNDDGEIEEHPQDDTQAIVADQDSGQQCGISAYGPGASNQHPSTGTTYATGDAIGYWPANQGTIFITDNFFAAGAGSAVAPVAGDIGEAYQITYAQFGTPDAGWGVEQTAGVVGVDVQAIILDVLDSRKDPIRLTSNTGVFVTFEINATLAAA